MDTKQECTCGDIYAGFPSPGKEPTQQQLDSTCPVHGNACYQTNTKQGKHTSGPWHYDGNDLFVFAYYDTTEPIRVADCENEAILNDDEVEANARLIAAAPEGYDLARLILETNDVPEGSIRRAARELLAKVDHD